jgi:hypothetical protein
LEIRLSKAGQGGLGKVGTAHVSKKWYSKRDIYASLNLSRLEGAFMPRERLYRNDAERQSACRQRKRERQAQEEIVRETEAQREEAQRKSRDLRTLLELIDEAERVGAVEAETARRLVGWIHRIP